MVVVVVVVVVAAVVVMLAAEVKRGEGGVGGPVCHRLVQ